MTPKPFTEGEVETAELMMVTEKVLVPDTNKQTNMQSAARNRKLSAHVKHW